MEEKVIVSLQPTSEADVLQTPLESNTDNGPQTQAGLASFSILTITISLMLSVFLVALDATILTTAVPKITDEFKSLTDVGWYGSAFFLTSAVFQLLFGRFYTIFPVKWTYLTAIGLFEIGSLLCGAAPNSTVLICGRAFAGIGSAGIFTGSMIIISQTIPLRWRSIYTSIFGAIFGVSSVIGPLMGGVFTDKLTWRWCFYINLFPGAITIIVLVIFFRPPEADNPSSLCKVTSRTTNIDRARDLIRVLDLPSSCTAILAITCMVLAFQWGGSKYSWKNARIIALLVVTAVLAILFLAIQVWRGDDAFLPLRILRQRTVWACCLFAFTGASGFGILIYYLPIYFQAIKGATALQSGLMNLPIVISSVLISLATGVLIAVIGTYTHVLIASSIIMAIGSGLLTTFNVNTSPTKWILYQLIYGIGHGCGIQQPILAVQTVLPQRDIPMGMSTVIFVQTIGSSIFVAAGQTVFTGRLGANLRALVVSGNTTIDAAAIISSGATGFRAIVAKADLGLVLTAYNSALMTAFYIAVALSCLSLLGSTFVEWKSVKDVGDNSNNHRSADEESLSVAEPATPVVVVVAPAEGSQKV